MNENFGRDFRWLARTMTTILLAWLLAAAARPTIGGSDGLIFLGGTFIAAHLGGRWAGWLGILLSCVLMSYYFHDPFPSIATFALTSTILLVISEGVRRGRLRENRLRLGYEEMLDGVGVAIISTDRAGRVAYLNPMAARLTGWRRPAAIGKPLRQVFRACDATSRVPCEDSIGRTIVEGRETRSDSPVVLVARDGHETSIEQSASPIRDARDAITGVVLAFREIAGRPRAAIEPAEGEPRYRLLFDVNPHPMWVFDAETLKFLAVNDATVLHYGYSRDEFLAMTLVDIRPPEDVGPLLRAVRRRRGVEYANSVGWRHRKKDGSIIDVEITSTSLDFDGKPARMILAHDVTLMHGSDRALRVSRERLDLVLGAAQLGVWYSDLPFGVLDWNDRCREHFGLANGEPVTIEAFRDRLHPEDREGVLGELDRAIRERDGVDFEFRTVGPGGRVRRVRSIGRVFQGVDGLTARFDAVTFDVTQARNSEAELREAKESAEAANRSKDRFLAVLGHELRTPLTPVLAAVTAILDEPGEVDADAEDMRPTLEMIRRSVQLEARLIDDLLDISRIVHGKLRLDRSSVEVHSLIRETIGTCRGDLDGKKMVLRYDLRATRDVIQADPARIRQVLWNLIKNAVKFSTEGGTIAIHSRDVDPEGDDAIPRLQVEVRDSGIGIEPDATSRIFEAFEQGEGPAARRSGGLGLGLGLAISRGLVEAHGGRLTAESPGPGRGSTFTLTMPTRDDARVEEPGPSQSPVSRGRSLRILLVEDDPITLEVLSKLLRQRGHEVRTAVNVASATAIFDRSTFDVLVSDIGLPDGTGLDLMRRLQATRPLRGVALTGFGLEEDIRRCREAGFLAHLTKPVSFRELEATIQQVAPDAVEAN